MRFRFLIVACLLLSGCTPMEWRRGDTVASFDSGEYRACRNKALLDSMRMMPLHSIYPTPFIGRDPFGRPIFSIRPWSHSDQFMLEHMNLSRCLEALGYELMPVPPKALAPSLPAEKPAASP